MTANFNTLAIIIYILINIIIIGYVSLCMLPVSEKFGIES